MSATNLVDRIDREHNRMMRRTNIETTGDEVFDEEIASQWKSLRVKENNFGDVYPADELEQDAQRKQRAIESFDDKEVEIARGLHTAIMEGISQYNWLGPNADIVFSSEYDDYFNGTDFVICFVPKDEHAISVKIGVDVTTSGSRLVLKKKLERILLSLERQGSLGRVKYFEYADAVSSQEPRGTIEFPKVILGTDAANTHQLMSSFSEAFVKKGPEGRQAREQLGKECIQYELLEEIMAQLCLQLESTLKTYESLPEEQCPESVNQLLNWIDDWYDQEQAGILSKELIEGLQHDSQLLAQDVQLKAPSHLKSARQIINTIFTIQAIQQEKSVRSKPNARKNLTARHLSRPDELFAA